MLKFETPNFLAGRIRSGDVSIDLIKPWSVITGFYCDDFGANLVKIVTKIVPVLAISYILFENINISLKAGIILCCSIFFSMVIVFLTKICASLICFWVTEAISIQILLDTVILLLSGRMIPSWILPKWLENVMDCLPFIWTIQKPIEICIGIFQTDFSREVSILFGVQLFWTVILLLCTICLWRKAYKRIIVQGG